MDYKELIKKLREKDGCRCECLQAATAIETLLAERDAAVKELHGRAANVNTFLPVFLNSRAQIHEHTYCRQAAAEGAGIDQLNHKIGRAHV